MTAIKTHQAEQFLKTIDSRYQAILVYGSDAGLVSERARTAARRLAAATQPPGEILRIEDADLEAQPDRLLTEIQTLPMFGGPKIVLTRASRRVTAQVLKPLVEEGTLAAILLVEAGNLRQDDALRKLFEKSSTAAAIACYGDEGRDLDSLVRDTLRQAGMTITREAQQALVNRLGADRAQTRGELEKLVLYTQGKQQIDVDDVDAIVGDAAELAIDKVVHATASGDVKRALTEFDRVIASGEGPPSNGIFSACIACVRASRPGVRWTTLSASSVRQCTSRAGPNSKPNVGCGQQMRCSAPCPTSGRPPRRRD